MNPIIAASVVALIRAGVTEWISWNAAKSRDAAWVPSAADVEEFLTQIAQDTPEALKAKVAQALGIPWPPEPPTAPEM